MYNDERASVFFPLTPPKNEKAPLSRAEPERTAEVDGVFTTPFVHWEVGQTLGDSRYELRALLGVGSMGAVLEAYDHETHETVAIKLSLDASGAQSQQIEREFGALDRLDHPNIVAAKSRTLAGVPFFTMERVHGQPFDAWVRPDYKLDTGRLRNALIQVASAVQALHAAGMIHCDLKPSNVLVTTDARAVLLDFGLVTYAQTECLEPTEAEVYGTPAYMAPEQAAGRPPSRASDTYALGVMLYQALTGRLPFAGSLSEILWARQSELPPPPSSWANDVPSDLEALCLDLMAIDPAKRPSDESIIARLSSAAA